MLTGVRARSASASIAGETEPSTPSSYGVVPSTTRRGTTVMPRAAAISAVSDAVESVTTATDPEIAERTWATG